MLKLIKAIFRIIFLIIIIASIAFAYARFIEPQMLQTKDVTVKSTYAINDENNITIALFADTHFGEYYSIDDFSDVLSSIEEINPDIVVFAGDLIDQYDSYTEDVSKISEQLAKIDAPDGKFAVFGNHDYGGGAENVYKDIMEAGGFKVLKNEYFALDELGVAIIGIDDVIIGYGNPEIAAWGRPDYYNIVLSHAPDVIDEVLDYNVDLMLSAHTHGRQVNIKYFDEYILPAYGKKYVKGLYQFENVRGTQLYVNSGIGMTKMPFRFLSPPELSNITISNKNN